MIAKNKSDFMLDSLSHSSRRVPMPLGKSWKFFSSFSGHGSKMENGFGPGK